MVSKIKLTKKDTQLAFELREKIIHLCDQFLKIDAFDKDSTDGVFMFTTMISALADLYINFHDDDSGIGDFAKSVEKSLVVSIQEYYKNKAV